MRETRIAAPLGAGLRVITPVLLAVAIAAFAGCSDLSSDSRRGGTGASASGTIAPAITGPVDPPLVIDSPAPGTWLTNGDIVVEGHATARAGDVVSVRVNGMPATLNADETWSGPARMTPGMNHITVAAENAAGERFFTHCSYMWGNYGSLADPVRDALLLRMNPQALPPINAAVNDLLATIDLNAALTAFNPVYANSFIFGVVTVRIDIQQLLYSSLTANLGLTQNGLGLSAVMRDVQIDIRAQDQGGFTIPFSVSGTIRADSLTVDTNVQLALQPDGTVESSLDPANVTLTGFRISLGGVPQLVVDLVANTVRGLLEDQVENALRDRVPPLIDDTINNLTKPTTLTLNGVDLTYTIAPNAIAIDPTGVGIGVDFDIAAPASPRALPAPGYMSTPSLAPTLGTQKGFYVSIDDDALNKAFHVAWQSGLLDIQLDQTTLAGLSSGGSAAGGITSLDYGSFATLLPEVAGVIDPATPLIIRLRPALPPYIHFGGGRPNLQVGEFYLEVLADTGGAPQSLVGLTVHADIAVDLTVQPGGALAVTMPSRPSFLFDVRDEPMTALDSLRLQTLLTIALDAMLPQVLSGLQFQVPSLGGLQIVDLELGPDGPSGDYLTVGANVIKQ